MNTPGSTPSNPQLESASRRKDFFSLNVGEVQLNISRTYRARRLDLSSSGFTDSSHDGSFISSAVGSKANYVVRMSG